MYRPKVNCSDHRWSSKIHNALPSFMNQRKSSDNHKLLSVIAKNANTYKHDFGAFTNARLLQNAHGKILDEIAADWGVNIVDENDDDFKRFQVRFQMLRHRIGPGTNDIKGAIAFLFNIPEDMFTIISTGLKAVKVSDLPFTFNSGDKSDLKREMIAGFIRGMLPPEYELTAVEYQEHADIWLFNGERVSSPIALDAQQYICAEEYDASTYTGLHGSSASVVMTTQVPPTIEENASVNNSYHAKTIETITATQSRKDQ